MKKLIFMLCFIGVEAQALAHEDPAPLSSNPIDWLLPGLAYVLPGVIAAVLLNHFVSRLNIAFRIILAVLFPMVFWLIFLYLLWSPERPFIEVLIEVPLLILSSKALSLIVIPSGLIIAAFGLLDHRRRKIAEHSEVYSEL